MTTKECEFCGADRPCDCLARAGCSRAGEPLHMQCGRCKTCNKPRFMMCDTYRRNAVNPRPENLEDLETEVTGVVEMFGIVHATSWGRSIAITDLYVRCSLRRAPRGTSAEDRVITCLRCAGDTTWSL